MLRQCIQKHITIASFIYELFTNHGRLIDFLVDLIATVEDQATLIESTWGLINLAFDYSNFSAAKQILERK